MSRYLSSVLAVISLFMLSASAQTCTVEDYVSNGDASAAFSGDGGDATSAKLKLSTYGGVWVDTSQNLFIADFNNGRVRAVNPDTKIISTIAGWTFSFSFFLLMLIDCIPYRIRFRFIHWRWWTSHLCWHGWINWSL